MTYGRDRFVSYWPENEFDIGDDPEKAALARWRVYELRKLASSYFVGSVVDSLAGLDQQSSYAWFPLLKGKSRFKRGERKRDGK